MFKNWSGQSRDNFSLDNHYHVPRFYPFLISTVLYNGTIQYLIFEIDFFSCSIILLKFTQVVMCVNNVFLFGWGRRGYEKEMETGGPSGSELLCILAVPTTIFWLLYFTEVLLNHTSRGNRIKGAWDLCFSQLPRILQLPENKIFNNN